VSAFPIVSVPLYDSRRRREGHHLRHPVWSNLASFVVQQVHEDPGHDDVAELSDVLEISEHDECSTGIEPPPKLMEGLLREDRREEMNQYLINELDAALMTRLNQILEDRVAQKNCPSVFATLFQGHNILMQTGIGERKIGAGIPGPETVYRIASCSKSFTVVMLLILRDRGLVNLDSPITDFVPEFTQTAIGHAYDPPTIRMLMSMSGGLPTDDPWADRQESITNETLRAIVSDGVLLTTAPGTQFQYSNLGYALLGQVIENVSGRPFRDLVKEEILLPLNLHETGYEEEIVNAEQLAHGYRKSPDGWLELKFSRPGAFSCIGGLFSSGRNLAEWVRWLLSALSDEPDRTGPLSVASRREMQQIVTAIPHGAGVATLPRHADRFFGYGLGLISERDTKYGQFVSHTGGYPGFSSHMRWHAPTGLGVVVLENATYSGAAQTATELIDQVLEDIAFQWPVIDVWTMTRVKAREANSLIQQWDDELASQIFEENVILDIPLDERKAQIERLIGELGGLTDSLSMQIQEDKSDSPLHMIWTIPAAHGALTCEIRLSPKTPSLIQTFKVSRN
jgi:CubicO group peptidase (beta-lactamase class C family)